MLGVVLRPQHDLPLPTILTSSPAAEFFLESGGDIPHVSPAFFEGCQLDDCDATTGHTEVVRAVAKELSKSKDNFPGTCPAVPGHQLSESVRTPSQRNEFSLLVAIRSTFSSHKI